MTRTSIIALTAIAMAFSGQAFAQANVTSTVQGATQAAGSTTVEAGGASATVNTGATANAAASGTADANNDGTITVEEQTTFDANVAAAANANAQTPAVSAGGSGNAAGSPIVTADANNDGTITDEERQAAATAAGAIALELACADAATALNGAGALDAAALGMVTKVVVVEVADCSEPPAGSVSAEAASSAISGNTMIMNEISMQLGGGMPGILGATMSGDTLTVYVNET